MPRCLMAALFLQQQALMLVLLQAALAFAAAASDVADAVPLTQHAMIITHDSATGYLEGGTFHVENNWAKTQGGASNHDDPVGFAGQLECGARAFDLRPKLDSGKVVMHHGPVTISKSMKDAVQEVVQWCAKNTDELVVLYISHYDGNGCEAAALKEIASLGVRTNLACADLQSMTVGAAKEAGRLPGGGSILAVNGCVLENYDSTIQCYGEVPAPAPATAPETVPETGSETAVPNTARRAEAGLYSCYGNDAFIPENKLFSYLNKTTAAPVSQLSMAQGHWQYSAESIAQGQAHFSTILDDESSSGTNQKLVAYITKGYLAAPNLIEVDHVCDHGPDLLAAVRQLNNKTSAAITKRLV